VNITKRSLFSAVIVLSSAVAAIAQNPPAAPPKKGGAPRLVLWVTSTSFADGAEIPMRHAARGENKSPAFEFRWNSGTAPAAAPDTVKSYAVIFQFAEVHQPHPLDSFR